MRKPSDTLSCADWNFDNVPDNELVACCWWEYARESAFICNTLKWYRDWFSAGGNFDHPKGDEACRNLSRIQSIGHPSDVFVRGLGLQPGMSPQHADAPPITGNFPTPWQGLSVSERRSRARIRTDVEQCGIVPVKLGEWHDAREIVRVCGRAATQQAEAWNAWAREYLRHDEKGNHYTVPGAPEPPQFDPIRPGLFISNPETLIVEIAWREFTNEEIAAYFRKWLKHARPKRTPIPDARGHKPSDWRANLTRLAVMRLLSRHTALELVDPRKNKCPEIWESEQFSRRKWGDVTKWHDARREAGKLFRRLFPFLPKDEKPLSWSRKPVR